jgi:hypothetical protein
MVRIKTNATALDALPRSASLTQYSILLSIRPELAQR